MENIKRTNQQVEKDYQTIRIAAETTTAISLKEFALELGGITVSQLQTSLDRHPRAKKRILKKIAENARKRAETEKARKKAEAEEARKRAEAEEARKRAEAEEARKRAEAEEAHKRAKAEKAAVLDASIVGFEGLHEYLEQKGTLILTSITIRELENLARFRDSHGIAARHLLAMAAENPQKVRSVLIKEDDETPDDCIISFAEDNKDDVILLTSDKAMALKARMYGVETVYLKHGENSASNKCKNTLLLATKADGKLVINTFTTPFRNTVVYSDSVEFKCGPYELKVGDDVFVATNKNEYLTFSHYHITSLEEENNCQLIFATRLYDLDKIEDLPKASYKSFMRDFKHRLEEMSKI